MPPTEEFKCIDESCELDMFENHYTYDADLETAEIRCPMCGGDSLERIEL